VFDYQETREGKWALEFLEDFSGHHQCDGYSGYACLHKKEGVICVACWAHARRKFFEITKIVKTPGLAQKMINLIGLLYKVEKEATEKGLDPGGIKELRQKKSKPVLENIKKLLDEYKDKAPPGSAIGKAIGYCLNRWPALIAYTYDGKLRIDNNDAERIIRPFAIGRKNWLFAATEKGAIASANIYSLIATCKANGINSYHYLRYVLQNIHAANSDTDLRALLPYNIAKNLLI
jgi:transposase